MGKSKGKGRKGKPKRTEAPPSQAINNFLTEAGPGCHICHYNADWIVGVEPFDADEYDRDVVIPDIALNPNERGVAVCVINTQAVPRTFYVSLAHHCVSGDGTPLQMGWTRDEQGQETECITFILVLAASTLMTVCYLQDSLADLEEVHRRIDSDVQPLQLHPAAQHFEPRRTYPFPLGGEAGDAGFLCTQGINGSLTHFFAGSHHAIDFRCPVGTRLLALGDGEVVDVRQSETVSGVHVSNLFKWNSLMLALDDGAFVEYVHLRANSVTVKLGERVRCGQQIAESGDVGFSPEPHLHLQMHTSRDPEAPTIMFALRAEASGKAYFPEAGHWYNAAGEVAEVNRW